MSLRQWNEVWSFKTKHFKVVLEATEDYDCDLSWNEDPQEIIDNINNGFWQCLGFRARVLYGPDDYVAMLSEDSIWGCIYENPKEFWQEHWKNKQPTCFSDMIHRVCQRARARIKSLPQMRA
jgi:hypothetical protein